MGTSTRVVNFTSLVMITQYLLPGKAFWLIANHMGACLDYDELWTWQFYVYHYLPFLVLLMFGL
jgi:hypothetical protein